MQRFQSISPAIAAKKSRIFLIAGSIAILCLAGILWRWNVSGAQKTQIRQVLLNRAQALEQKNLALYLSCFSPNYQSGARTYQQLRTDAEKWFAQFAVIRASFEVINIDIQGETAVVEDTYAFSLTNGSGETLPIGNRELLQFQRTNKEWKITSSLSLE